MLFLLVSVFNNQWDKLNNIKQLTNTELGCGILMWRMQCPLPQESLTAISTVKWWLITFYVLTFVSDCFHWLAWGKASSRKNCFFLQNRPSWSTGSQLTQVNLEHCHYTKACVPLCTVCCSAGVTVKSLHDNVYYLKIHPWHTRHFLLSNQVNFHFLESKIATAFLNRLRKMTRPLSSI